MTELVTMKVVMWFDWLNLSLIPNENILPSFILAVLTVPK